MTIIRRLIHWLELDHSPSRQFFECPCKFCTAWRVKTWGDPKPRPNWFAEGFEQGLSEEMVWQSKVEASSNGLDWVRAKEPEE